MLYCIVHICIALSDWIHGRQPWSIYGLPGAQPCCLWSWASEHEVLALQDDINPGNKLSIIVSCMQAAPSPPPPSKKVIEQVVSAPQKKVVSHHKKSSQAEVLVSGG